MTKLDFLKELRKNLGHLSQDEIEERVIFYNEMIDEMVEEGLSEEEAVSKIENSAEAVFQRTEEKSAAKPNKAKKAKKRTAFEIVLLVLGAPLWLSFLIAAASVLFSLLISMWAVIVSLWSVFVSFAVCTIAFISCSIGFTASGSFTTGIVLLGAALIFAGLSILSFFGCQGSTKGGAWLTKKTFSGIKKCFSKKEAQ